MPQKGNVLVRMGKMPFLSASPVETLLKNLTLSNTGNLLFQHAFVRSMYQPQLNIFPMQDGPFTVQDIEKINANFDAVYLTFANAFRTTFRSALKNWTAVIKKINIPVVIVGVGAQCATDNPMVELEEINADVRDLCAAVLEKSESIGVRGEFTANYLNDLGIKNVDIIGCPSMFYFGAALPVPPQIDFSALREIAFHFSPQSPDNFGKRNPDADAQLEAMLQFMLHKENMSCTYIAQDTQELQQRVWGTKGVTLAHYAPLLANVATLYPLDPDIWIKDLQKFDIALGTRIHGSIAAVLAGIPSFMLCHDSRTAELANWFGLPRIEKAQIQKQTLTPDLLCKVMEDSDMHKVFPDRFLRYTNFLRKNNIPSALQNDSGSNPNWEQYDKDIENACLLPSLDHDQNNLQLINEKINYVYRFLMQKSKS
jgi:hypothetical protein